jgi:hypothetical protein
MRVRIRFYLPSAMSPKQRPGITENSKTLRRELLDNMVCNAFG